MLEALPGAHLNRFVYLQAGSAWLKESYAINTVSDAEAIGLPELVETEKWLAKILLTADRRRYNRQHVNGWTTQLLAEHVNSPFDPVPFYKLFNETRWYKQSGSRNYAGRLRLGVATNTFSPFPPFVIDSYINIRGSGNRVARGTAEAILTQEYRYTVHENQWGALQIIGFSDLGTLRPAGGNLNDAFSSDNIIWRTGVGGRVFLAGFYHLFLRADFGFNPLDYQENGFVLGLGQYF